MSARAITVLGSTGSVGRSTLDLVERNREQFRLVALTAHRDVVGLADQAKRLRPQLAVVADEACYAPLKTALAGTGITVAAGADAVAIAAAERADWVMAAIVGAAGLKPTLAAVGQGATVAIANKESLVCAGPVVLDAAKRSGATLLPVDSEHNAIFQVFDFSAPEKVARVILTASGGPFRTLSLADMARATPEQAVAHPVWSMGAKISVDSATLMNKGLELIEAHHLFPVNADQLDVVIHPQSVIHSLVEYVDGSMLAQMGTPDMRIPIAYTLAYPQRLETPSARLDLPALKTLSFEAPDTVRFPALNLAWQALRAGGAAPAVLNAANEIAVQAFLDRRIGFLDIAAIVSDVLSGGHSGQLVSLGDALAADAAARAKASAAVQLRGRG
jgi:1-deoxy-D-xylulose-5-phosphate reductoisomerase